MILRICGRKESGVIANKWYIKEEDNVPYPYYLTSSVVTSWYLIIHLESRWYLLLIVSFSFTEIVESIINYFLLFLFAYLPIFYQIINSTWKSWASVVHHCVSSAWHWIWHLGVVLGWIPRNRAWGGILAQVSLERVLSEEREWVKMQSKTGDELQTDLLGNSS